MDRISGIGAGSNELTPAEKAMVAKLAARDREVRAHEAAHMAAAGGLASGGAQFIYEMGPDGKMYAVGGEVKIALMSGGTPEEALARARQLRAAATAPNDPSGQDASVAAAANRMEAKAQAQLANQKEKETSGTSSTSHGLDSVA